MISKDLIVLVAVHIFPQNFGILTIINNKWMSLPCSYLKDAPFYLFAFYIFSDIYIVTRKAQQEAKKGCADSGTPAPSLIMKMKYKHDSGNIFNS